MDDPALQALYPFLHGGRPDAARLDRALLDAVQAKANDSVEAKRNFFAAHADGVVAMAHALAGVWRGGGRLYTAGNGGSSCDAAHIAVEFNHPITAGRTALAAVHLGADLALLTALGNDVGFDQVFARALLAQARAGDALLVVSTSGNSANLLAALAAARRAGLVTLALSGHDGGAIARSADCDHCLVVASASIHRVQETHVAIYHVLWDLVHTLLAGDRGPAR
jgi:D-sedoheptulose 7-phosphate isomerase